MVDTYDDIREYIDEEEIEEERRRYALRKALDLAGKKKTKQEPSSMSDNDVVEAARKFNEFLQEGE